MSDPTDNLRQQADRWMSLGQHAKAADAYRRLVAEQPALTDCWYNLGYVLKAQGRYGEALAAYDEALKRGIRGAEEVHLNRAVIFSDCLRRDNDALKELKAALELAPEYLPALLNLGNLHEERGERAAAVQCYRRILSLTAGTPAQDDAIFEALARLLHLEPPQDPQDSALQRVRQAARSKTGGPVARANLMFALGRTCDALGLHEEAFVAFADANRHAREIGPRYDAVRFERFVDALESVFSTRGKVEETAPGSSGVGPIFICGMFRSGSTLIEQVLAAHPEIAAGGELDLLQRLVSGPLRPFPESLRNPGSANLVELTDTYRRWLVELVPRVREGLQVTDKRPDNFLLIGLIQRLFPGARIIHTVRHPLDNGLSIFMQHLDARVAPYANDLGEIGHYFGQYRRLMAHWKALWPDRIHDFHYDAFVREPEANLQALLNFLDLPWDERCLEFHRAGNTVKTASYWQVRRPLYRQASGRWRHYLKHLGALRQALVEGAVPLED